MPTIGERVLLSSRDLRGLIASDDAVLEYALESGCPPTPTADTRLR